jgi:hypothetical protein
MDKMVPQSSERATGTYNQVYKLQDTLYTTGIHGKDAKLEGIPILAFPPYEEVPDLFVKAQQPWLGRKSQSEMRAIKSPPRFDIMT